MTTTSVGACQVRQYRLAGGRREGIEVLEIDNGAMRLLLLPQRGLGIWKVFVGDREYGWRSPVSGPVHPAFVPLQDASGLGWLEGFDELLCRCGLQSNGPPVFHGDGRLAFGLHGRVANLPAENLQIHHDEATGRVEVTGVVNEMRFLQFNLRLTSTLIVEPGVAGFGIRDSVTNLAPTLAHAQLMYHYNVGLPVLGEGAKVVAPIKELAPRDARAAEGLRDWDHIGPPQHGFAEQVFYTSLHARDDGSTQVLLMAADATSGAGIRFNTRQLPCFVVWKNCADARDGYVVGIEPSTNFPNPRPFEIEHGRAASLESGQRASFDLRFEFYTDQEQVRAVQREIAVLTGGSEPQVFDKPRASWSPASEC